MRDKTSRLAPTFKFNKRAELFIGTHNKAFSVVAIRISNKDCSPVTFHGLRRRQEVQLPGRQSQTISFSRDADVPISSHGFAQHLQRRRIRFDGALRVRIQIDGTSQLFRLDNGYY